MSLTPCFSQQLFHSDNIMLANMLGIEKNKTESYEVFVTKLCDGNLRECCKNETLNNGHRLSMIKQMIEMVKQLKASGKSHNDIKPGNVLYVKKPTTKGFEIQLQLADFGICNQAGGTPGWSLPDFTNDRQPGDADLYSMGLVILYLLCEDEELFYAIRDNYVPFLSTSQPWLTKFRNSPALLLICQMIEPLPKSQCDLDNCAKQWQNMRIEVINRSQLIGCFQVPNQYLKLQFGSVQQKQE